VSSNSSWDEFSLMDKKNRSDSSWDEFSFVGKKNLLAILAIKLDSLEHESEFGSFSVAGKSRSRFLLFPRPGEDEVTSS